MDIYFQKEYGKINELIEDGEAKIFDMSTEYGRISNMHIVRKIPYLVDGIQYYDIVSPYGYGGPVILNCKEGKKQELLNEYENKFALYCKENNIVSEFVRFHPIINNGRDFQNVYNSQCIRKTVGINLRDYDEPTQEEFNKNCRKKIRRAIKNGITYNLIESPDNVESFKKIYYMTMERNQASAYYYFSDDYFDSCLKYFKNNLIMVEALYEGNIIAAGVYFLWDKTIHVHLTGTINEYLHLSPEYILMNAIVTWGKENGYHTVHCGGGRSNAEDDSLYVFKKQFGQNTSFDFYVGRKKWNEEVYDELCLMKGIDKNIEFFPAYRSQ